MVIPIERRSRRFATRQRLGDFMKTDPSAFTRAGKTLGARDIQRAVTVCAMLYCKKEVGFSLVVLRTAFQAR